MRSQKQRRFRRTADDARGVGVQLYQSESHSIGDSLAPTRGETSAEQLPGAITARVLPDDSRPNGCGNRIFTQRRKLEFQLRTGMGASRGCLSKARTPSQCGGCAGKATRLMPTSRYAWKHLAEAYQATGRSADAQRAAARAQQLGGAIAKANKKKA